MAVSTFIIERYVINIQNSFTALLGHLKMIREPIQCHQIVAGDFKHFNGPFFQMKSFAEADL